MIVQPDVLAFRITPAAVKRAFYARIGVHEHWIVDQAARRVERWRAGATEAVLETGVLTWHPEGVVRPLALDLPLLFDAIPEPYRTP